MTPINSICYGSALSTNLPAIQGTKTKSLASLKPQNLFSQLSQTLGEKSLSTTTHKFSARELILYQVRFQELHLKVELVSRVADSALATLRKLQTPQ